MKKILIADDERSICDAFSRMIEMEGHQALVASNGKNALKIINEEQPNAIFMDIRMPVMDGLEALNQLQEQNIKIPVVIMTAYGTMETAMEAVQKGAFDYLGKPVELDKARNLLKQMLDYSTPDTLTADSIPNLPETNILVGQSASMQELFKLMGMLTTNNMTALITGESGVGKELVARGIHIHSQNKHEPFIAINCAAIPENLLESELFGYEKGAFTGADVRREGRFESAAQGTLFLDEIGELPLTLQSKLLRVIQERSFERIGSHTSIPLNARIIAASNRNLETEVANKRFREDLYHRLNVIPLKVPPLRQRKEDIELLANYFLQQASHELNKPLRGVKAEVIAQLSSYSWPGNVRELEHVIKRAALLTKMDHITRHDLNIPETSFDESLTSDHTVFEQLNVALSRALHDAIDRSEQNKNKDDVFHQLISYIETQLITETLQICNNNQVLAAKKLGLHRTTLRKKIPKSEQ